MVPFALLSTGWTVVAAFGGAVVGAVATALMTWWLDVRRQEKLLKAGCRLLADEFFVGGIQVREAAEERKWFSYSKWHDGIWDEYRAVMVERLPDKEFDQIAGTARAVREIFVGYVNAPNWPEGQGWMPLDSTSTKHLEDLVAEVVATYNLLAGRCGVETIMLNDLRADGNVPADDESRG